MWVHSPPAPCAPHKCQYCLLQQYIKTFMIVWVYGYGWMSASLSRSIHVLSVATGEKVTNLKKHEWRGIIVFFIGLQWPILWRICAFYTPHIYSNVLWYIMKNYRVFVAYRIWKFFTELYKLAVQCNNNCDVNWIKFKNWLFWL